MRRTCAPAAWSRRTVAAASRAKPTTVTGRPSSASRKAAPRVSVSMASSLIMKSSPQLECRQREERQCERDDPEAHDDLRLRPPGQLVVVVERRHAEDAAARQLEARDLDDHGARLDHVEPADERQQQL